MITCIFPNLFHFFSGSLEHCCEVRNGGRKRKRFMEASLETLNGIRFVGLMAENEILRFQNRYFDARLSEA